MKFRMALPGTHHIPPANDNVPEAAQWASGLTAPDFQRIAAAVDELRYDAITVSDHLGMPYFEVPRLGPFWMDALSVMSFVAGSTRRVRVDASVLVAPYRHPLALAKALSTIDVLSGGRIDVSVGVGHAEREFEVLGIDFDQRGAITDETLDAVLELWSADEPSFQGRFFRIDGLAFEPKPVQQPRPPIYVGGNSRPALRRASRYDGWQPNPTEFSVEEIPPLLDYIRDQPEFTGKEKSFELCWVGTVPGASRPIFADLMGGLLASYRDQVVDRLGYLAGLGITMVAVPAPITQSPDEFIDFVRWFDEEVISRAG
jgi:probable F420-dependent oxidoreductase